MYNDTGKFTWSGSPGFWRWWSKPPQWLFVAYWLMLVSGRTYGAVMLHRTKTRYLVLQLLRNQPALMICILLRARPGAIQVRVSQRLACGILALNYGRPHDCGWLLDQLVQPAYLIELRGDSLRIAFTEPSKWRLETILNHTHFRLS